MKYITKGSEHYIDRKELLEEVLKSQKNDNTPTQKLYDMMILLVERVGWKFTYIKDEDREDCAGEALLTLFNKWHTFDIERTDNIFAFLTQIAINGYRAGFLRMYPQYHCRKKQYVNTIITINNIHTL